MAFVYCKKCGWDQDDFWYFKIQLKKIFKWSSRPFGYNPLSLVLEDIAIWGKPRYINLDVGRTHSWKLLIFDVKRHLKLLFTQKWWTEHSFTKDYFRKKAKCPNCGSTDDFIID